MRRVRRLSIPIGSYVSSSSIARSPVAASRREEGRLRAGAEQHLQVALRRDLPGGPTQAGKGRRLRGQRAIYLAISVGTPTVVAFTHRCDRASARRTSEKHGRSREPQLDCVPCGDTGSGQPSVQCEWLGAGSLRETSVLTICLSACTSNDLRWHRWMPVHSAHDGRWRRSASSSRWPGAERVVSRSVL